MNRLTNQSKSGPARLCGAFGIMMLLAHGAAVAAPTAKTDPMVRGKLDRADSGPRCSGEAARPGKVTLQMGKSTLMRLPEPVMHRSIGNATVAQAMLVSPDTLYLVGVNVGATNMIIQGRSGGCSMVEINVMMDVAGLEAALALAMPEEKNIKVTTAADTIVLTGTVADGAAAARAVKLAIPFVHQPLTSLLREGDDAGVPAEKGSAAKLDPELRVINLLSVAAPQQVMLEVKIAEVSKTLLERLEGSTRWRFNSGSWATTLLADFLTKASGNALDVRKSNGNGVTADAQKTDSLVRILAEPNVMAISGQEGSFLAGGRIFIPVAQDNNKITLEEKEFGVGLRFTPTVLAGGRINLRVAPEVSEVSREGIGISAAGFTGGAVLPLITTRRASTTVQLYDGQSFAIGGLIKNNLVTSLKGLPGLGEVPVLGALFRSADYQQDRTELVFVVTAHLVKPLPPNFQLPTDKIGAPTRSELLFGGQLSGTADRGASAGTAAPAGAAQAPVAGSGESVTSAAEPASFKNQRDFELK